MRSPAEALAEAQRLLDAGRPFHAHEVLEDAWKSAPTAERPLWKALAQLAVAATHAARGNRAGAATLRARAADTLRARNFAVVAAQECAVDVDGLIAWADGGGDGVPRLTVLP